MRKAYTIKSGLIAILIYILIIFIAIFAFVQNTKDDKSQGSKEQIIKVDMSGIDMPSSQKPNDKPQNQKLPKKEEVQEPKKIENILEEKKAFIEKGLTEKEFQKEEPKEIEKPNKPLVERKKEKPETNSTIKKTRAVKKPIKETSKTLKDTTSLFETIDLKAPSMSAKKTAIVSQKQTVSGGTLATKAKATGKASDLIGNALSAKSSGVEEGYKSKVKSILNGWPAQSNFAGNKARIKFVIEPSGRFEFEIISQSSNEEFNKGLVQYLRQLQRVGFGAHGGGRAYIFDVDFIAER